MMNKILMSWALCLVVSSYAHSAGNTISGKANTAVCSSCHGEEGNSVIESFPKLAGQNVKYLMKQLFDIQSDRRPVPEMAGMLNGKNGKDLKELAVFFSRQNIIGGKTALEQFELGQRIYRAGIIERNIVACSACHGATGQGIKPAGIPALSGQHAQYLMNQLNNFKIGARANDPNQMMQDVASKLSRVEIEAVAHYIQGLH